MNGTIVISVLILFIGIIFYLLIRQGYRQIKNINTVVLREAKIRNLQINSMISPTFSEWKNSPFNSEIKIGSLGFEGIPYNREFYRILKCKNPNSPSEQTIWVRITRSYKTGTLTLEWKDQANNM